MVPAPPDAAAKKSFGRGALGPVRCARAARAGPDQAPAHADAVKALWGEAGVRRPRRAAGRTMGR
ncbi:hypothetical protein ACFYM2_14815 [Streptomyces sp. NPDC006711]|uniref:hypothetical protein n=1 Tax=Streptomyces sp. NPDC006711 TaxID=3364762 RepID=UPI00369D34B9